MEALSEILAEERKTFSESYCVVPKPSHRGHVRVCHEHAKLISKFFRLVKLDGYHFDFIQRQAYTSSCHGNTTLELKLENGHNSKVCALYILRADENRWRYVLEHSKMSSKDIYDCIRESFGGKEKIHLDS